MVTRVFLGIALAGSLMAGCGRAVPEKKTPDTKAAAVDGKAADPAQSPPPEKMPEGGGVQAVTLHVPHMTERLKLT